MRKKSSAVLLTTLKVTPKAGPCARAEFAEIPGAPAPHAEPLTPSAAVEPSSAVVPSATSDVTFLPPTATPRFAFFAHYLTLPSRYLA